MSTYPIFGITGYATSGKGTIAHHLCNKYGYQPLSLGAALRELIAEINPIVAFYPKVHSTRSITTPDATTTTNTAPNTITIPTNTPPIPNIAQPHEVNIVRYTDAINQYGYTDAKRVIPEVRKVLVGLGNGARKHIHPDVWLDIVLPKNYSGTRLVVIDDIRHANEVNRVKELGGFIIRVDRPGIGPANEVEKASLDEVVADFRLHNNGTVLDLVTVVDYLMNNHFPQYCIKRNLDTTVF